MESHLDKKFYVPDITEFHVGFECEVNWNKGYEDNFVPLIIDVKDENGAYTNTLQEVIRAYDDKYAEFRVKYLDQEDIESLEWFHFSSDFSFSVFTKIKDKKQKYYLEYDHNLNTLEISIVNSEGNIFVKNLFSGKIKNKSELKKLLKMLEITDNQ